MTGENLYLAMVTGVLLLLGVVGVWADRLAHRDSSDDRHSHKPHAV